MVAKECGIPGAARANGFAPRDSSEKAPVMCCPARPIHAIDNAARHGVRVPTLSLPRRILRRPAREQILVPQNTHARVVRIEVIKIMQVVYP